MTIHGSGGSIGPRGAPAKISITLRETVEFGIPEVAGVAGEVELEEPGSLRRRFSGRGLVELAMALPTPPLENSTFTVIELAESAGSRLGTMRGGGMGR